MKKKKNTSKQNTRTMAEKVFSNPGRYVVPTTPRKKKVAPTAGAALSPCALKYALAISEPFHPSARGACLPRFPSPPSQKVTGFVRFVATVGTSGFGFVSVGPCLANDGIVSFATTSAFTQTTLVPLSANNILNTGIQTVSLANLPYNTTNLTTGELGSSLYANRQSIAGRVVSLGVRITYTGTTLNESGVYYVWSSPIHENAIGVAQAGTSILGALADCDVCGTTRMPCESVVYPALEDESNYTTAYPDGASGTLYPYSAGATGFNSDLFYAPASGVNVGSQPIVIGFTGVAGSTYLVEIIQHCEYTGLLAAGLVTSSDADQVGFERVTAAAERIPQLKMAEPGKTMKDYMFTALSEVTKTLKPIAITALKAGGLGILNAMGRMML